MGYALRLNRKRALIKLSKLSDTLFTNNNIKYDLRSDLSILHGDTYFDECGYAVSVNLGAYEIDHAHKSALHFVEPLVSDLDFVRVVLNTYHEYVHCVQANQIFRKDILDEYEERQLLQSIACYDNPDYYINDGNYTINANEIQAEQIAIGSTYDYLCKEFKNVSSSYIESMLVNIVNDKAQASMYFLKSKKSFQSLKEINHEFDKVYDESFDKNRYYYVNAKNTRDAVKLYMREHHEIKDYYLSLSDSSDKDKYIAAINLRLHPMLKSSHKVLQNRNLFDTLCMTDKSDVRLKALESTFPELLDISEDQEHDGLT